MLTSLTIEVGATLSTISVAIARGAIRMLDANAIATLVL